jgi:hypothetical protein
MALTPLISLFFSSASLVRLAGLVRYALQLVLLVLRQLVKPVGVAWFKALRREVFWSLGSCLNHLARSCLTSLLWQTQVRVLA